MSEMKLLGTRTAPASAPVGKLSIDGTVALRHMQARRPPVMTGSNRPMILLAEKRESTRVALKKVLEATGYDVLEQAVRLDVFAGKVSEMIETRQGIQQKR